MEFLKEPLIMLIECSTIFYMWYRIGLPLKENKLKLVVYILIMSILQAYISKFTLRFLITHIITVISVAWLFRRSLKKTLVEFATIILVTYPLSAIVVAFSGLILDPDPNNYGSRFLGVCIYAISLFILFKFLPVDMWYKKYESTLENFIYAFIAILLLSNMFTLVRLNDVEKFLQFSFIFAAFVAVNMAFIHSYKESREQKEMIRDYDKYTDTIIPLLDEIRSRQHDFKNHLAAIYGYCQTSEDAIGNIRNYVEELNESLKSADTLIRLKDKTIGAIIYSKACEAQSKNIEFKYEISEKSIDFPFKNYEYAALVSNLIDNAFEAPLASETESKKVILKIGADNQEKFIEVWNNGAPVPVKDIPKLFKRGFSTKTDKPSCGYGLYTVKKIASYYYGNIEVVSQGEYTVFRIAFAK